MLILDGQFNRVPAAGEKLRLLDDTAGKLLVGDRSYTGRIEVWRGEGGLYLIDSVDIEDYIRGVVKSETGSDWAMEALKAQAVISRTYAAYKLLHSPGMKYDLTSSVLDQVYGCDAPDGNVCKAVDETRGQILVYDGKPIEAFFHSTSCGETEDPYEVFGTHLPYLKPVKVNCGLSPYSEWDRQFSAGRLQAALKSGGIDTGPITGVRIKSHTCTGRVRDLLIEGKNGVFKLKATDARKLLGWRALPSTDFTLSFNDGFLDLEGRGYGHGVGLSQWSALQMARQGETYRQILAYFYPGARLEQWGAEIASAGQAQHAGQAQPAGLTHTARK
ncbi:MAG: SpoIID/LytB domain-containing protein [Nitrospiraceae bacterium]|nr:SpoIID/LytB domain-containing protein [Nitrospiraceae bacterium]